MADDRIVKKVVLQAPVARVWRAVSDAGEFGAWFGVTLRGSFAPGARVRGVFDAAQAPPTGAIAAMERQLGLEPAPIKMPDNDTVFCVVDRIEEPRYFAFRWIPYGIDASIDPVNEPMTLVEFHLEPQGAGATALTITESGFDKVPAHRRRRAFLMNEGGWAAQADNIKRFVEGG